MGPALTTDDKQTAMSSISEQLGDSSRSSLTEDYHGEDTNSNEKVATEEGYFPDEVEREFSNNLIGGDEIERHLSRESEDEENGAHSTTDHVTDDKGEPLKLKRSLSRRVSLAMQEKFGIFDKEIKNDMVRTVFLFLRAYVMIIVFMLTVFSVYWGSTFHRAPRFKNLKMLIVNEDNVEIDGISPLIGNTISTRVPAIPSIESTGDWQVRTAEFQQLARDRNTTVEEQVRRAVHQQNYWTGIYVRPNTTYDFYQAFRTANTSFNANGTYVSLFYETGRDLTNMGTYIIPFLNLFQSRFYTVLSESFLGDILNYLTDQEKTNLITQAPQLISTLPLWRVQDMRPASSTVLIAPYQIGCIYLIIITFFQFNFFVQVHQQVAQKVKPSHYILYRMISSQISYVVLSLGYSCVSAAFQVNFNLAYKGGFGVYWMISYLTMAAVGGANENVAMICFSTFPPALGFWILGWVIINISPTFSAMALTPHFYRYGYAIPIHNSVEAFKVVLFNTTRRELGRNVGILVAWIVVNNLFQPFVMKFFASQMKKKAIAAAALNQKK